MYVRAIQEDLTISQSNYCVDPNCGVYHDVHICPGAAKLASSVRESGCIRSARVLICRIDLVQVTPCHDYRAYGWEFRPLRRLCVIQLQSRIRSYNAADERSGKSYLKRANRIRDNDWSIAIESNVQIVVYRIG